MTNVNDNHVTHLIDAYLAGGLDVAERTSFEAHTIVCAACAAALESARQADQSLVDLFAAAQPDAAFEQRLVAELRPAMAAPVRGRWRGRMLHPLVRRIAVGVAAAIVLGGVGYGMQMGMEAVERQRADAAPIKAAGNIRSMAQHGFMYANDDTRQSGVRWDKASMDDYAVTDGYALAARAQDGREDVKRGWSRSQSPEGEKTVTEKAATDLSTGLDVTPKNLSGLSAAKGEGQKPADETRAKRNVALGGENSYAGGTTVSGGALAAGKVVKLKAGGASAVELDAIKGKFAAKDGKNAEEYGLKTPTPADAQGLTLRYRNDDTNSDGGNGSTNSFSYFSTVPGAPGVDKPNFTDGPDFDLTQQAGAPGGGGGGRGGGGGGGGGTFGSGGRGPNTSDLTKAGTGSLATGRTTHGTGGGFGGGPGGGSGRAGFGNSHMLGRMGGGQQANGQQVAGNKQQAAGEQNGNKPADAGDTIALGINQPGRGDGATNGPVANIDGVATWQAQVPGGSESRDKRRESDGKDGDKGATARLYNGRGAELGDRALVAQVDHLWADIPAPAVVPPKASVAEGLESKPASDSGQVVVAGIKMVPTPTTATPPVSGPSAATGVVANGGGTLAFGAQMVDSSGPARVVTMDDAIITKESGARSTEKLLKAPEVASGKNFRPGEIFGEKSKDFSEHDARKLRVLSDKSNMEKDAVRQSAQAALGTAAADAKGIKDSEKSDKSGPALAKAADDAPKGEPAKPGQGQPGNGEIKPDAAGKPEAAPADPAKPAPPETAKPESATPEAPATPAPEAPKTPDGPIVKPEEVPAPKRQPTAPIKQMVIRNGTLQFEVDSFDSALIQMNKIVGEEGGYLSGTSSDKLANGKVRGIVTLRVPPDRLDTLILKLRGMGDLKSQRVSAEDVTKHFTDISSQYRASKAMEERLLAIIKAGGLVKDLLEAEKQLGIWREKIEVLEGEMRYIENLVSMSTLTVELMERDVRTPTAASEQETVNTAVETEDVESGRTEVLKAIEAVKGRVVDSDLKKFEGGQLSATIVADVNPESSGTVIDRLRQLGKLARLDISRKTTTQGGSGPIIPGLKVEKRETRLQISLYNLANIEPRQTTTLNLAAPDVEAAYKAILEQVKGAGGRVVASQLNRPKADQTVGTITFQAPTDKADVLLGTVRAGVEVMRMEVATNPDAQNTTEAKRGFSVQIYSLAHVPPRETTTIQLASAKVPDAFNKLLEAAKAGGGRIITSQLNEQDPNNITGTIEFEAMRDKMNSVTTAMQEAGLIVTRNVTRSPDTETTVDSKVRMSLSLIDDLRLAPRETISARVATPTVQDAFSALVTAAKESGARVVGSNLNLNDRTNPTGTLNFSVPRENAAKFETALKAAGVMISRTVNRQADGPMNVESKIGFDVTVFDELQLQPRETVSAVIATKQVPEAFNALANAARDAGARVVGSNLNLADRMHPAGDLNFAIPRENREKFEAALKAAGLLVSNTVTRQQDGPMVADNKTGFAVSVRDERTMQPRESQQMRVVTKSVTDRYNKLLETLRLMDAQVIQSRLVQERRDSTVGVLEFVIQRTDRAAIEKALSDNADVFDRTVQRSQDNQNTVDHRLLYSVELRDADQQRPRQTYDISLQANDIGAAANDLEALAVAVGGKNVGSVRTQEGNGEVVEMALDVPLDRKEGMLNGVRSAGKVSSMQQRRDDDVPEGTLSRARVHVTLRPPPTVGAERGMGDSLRGGLNTGLNLLSAAAGYLVTGVIGLLIVVALLLVLWPIVKIFRRMRNEKREPPARGGTGGIGGTGGTPAPITPPTPTPA